MEENFARERMAEVASGRSNLYGFLSLIFRQEPTVELLRQIRQPDVLKALSELGICLEKAFLNGNEEQLTQDLVLEYTRLFLGPGSHIPPYESVYRQDEERPGLLWGKSTVEVKQFIEWLGLTYRKGNSAAPDHISVELELMQKLTQEEQEAWEKMDQNLAARCLKYEKRFIEDHLLKWIQPFCERIIEEAKLFFYRDMAKLTKAYILFDEHQISKLLEQLSKENRPFVKIT